MSHASCRLLPSLTLSTNADGCQILSIATTRWKDAIKTLMPPEIFPRPWVFNIYAEVALCSCLSVYKWHNHAI
ncbi:805_t:CDS:2, partial [Acaulospora morrowiae]